MNKSFKEICIITWPQMVMMIFHFIIGFVDVWTAGRISTHVQASIGVMTQTLFFFLIIAIALANGSVATISQSQGALRKARVKRFVALGLLLSLFFGTIMAIVGYVFRKSILDIIFVPDAIVPIATYLISVYIILLPIYFLFIQTNAISRALKLVHIPMYSMCIVCLINLLCDLGFGLGFWGLPSYGYKGIAWGTFISVFCGAIFNCYVLFRKQLFSKVFAVELRWLKKAIPYLIQVALPSALMQLVWHSAYLALYAITGSLPHEPVLSLAGFSAGIRIESLVFLPGFAFNFTSAILIGDLLGKREFAEAKRRGFQIALVGVVFMTLLALVVGFNSSSIISFVAPDVDVQFHAQRYLWFNLSVIPFLVMAIIFGGAFTGAGATLIQMVVFGIAAWGIRIPLALYLGHHVMGNAQGVWIAMAISVVIQAVLMLLCFTYLPWERFAMRKEIKTKDRIHI